MKAAQYDHFGGPDLLQIVELPVLDTRNHTLVAEPLDNPVSEMIQRKPYVPA